MKNAAIAVLAVLVVLLGFAAAASRVETRRLQAQNDTLRRQIEDLTAARPEPVKVTQVQREETEAEAGAEAEVIRLRGEVSALRRDKEDAKKLRGEIEKLRTERAANQATRMEEIKVPRTKPRDAWTFSGYADPEAAMQTALWAGASGDVTALAAALSPEQLARMQKDGNKTEAEVLQDFAREIAKIKGFQILENRAISENETVLTLFVDGKEGSEQTPRVKMKRFGNEWKVGGPYTETQPDAPK